MVMPKRRKSSFYLVNSYQWARWLLYAVLQWQTVKELLWHKLQEELSCRSQQLVEAAG